MMRFLKKMNESHWIMTSIIILLIGFIFGIMLGIGIVKNPTVEVVTPPTESTSVQEETEEIPVEPEITPEVEEKGKALRQAELSMSTGSGMSKAGLYDFLTVTYNYSPKAAEYAVNNVNVDWKEKAYGKLSSYLTLNKDWDYERAYSQLEYERFTKEEIEYALEKAGFKKAE